MHSSRGQRLRALLFERLLFPEVHSDFPSETRAELVGLEIYPWKQRLEVATVKDEGELSRRAELGSRELCLLPTCARAGC